MPGKVKVKIISGRNLPVMDRSSDTTDAYVEIKLGSTTYKTDVCRKSLHPHWNSEWYRFEVDDSELQDEPLQIRLMDHDTYSANDAIGKVYLDLNPLLLSSAGSLIKYGDTNTNHEPKSNSVMSGWIPVYDTMHGIRGEVNVIVKVELFSDFNRFRQSSCGIQFFCSRSVPQGYFAQTIYGFVEELVVNDDPEYQWIDKIRTPRASNEARQTLFFKLSGELQRKIGLKALDLGGNAVIGYCQCFDLEGESGIVARGIGTAVTLIKLIDNPLTNVTELANEERALNYLKFLGSDAGFRLNAGPIRKNPNKKHYIPSIPNINLANPKYKRLAKHLSRTEFKEHIRTSRSNPVLVDNIHRPVHTLLKQEDMRGVPGHGLTQKIKNLKYSSQTAFSKKVIALKAKLGDTKNDEGNIKDKRTKYKRTISDSSVMAQLLARSVIHAHNSLSSILEIQDSSSKINEDDDNDDDDGIKSCTGDSVTPNLLEETQSDPILSSVQDDILETPNSSSSSFDSSSSDYDDEDDDDDDEDEDNSDENNKEIDYETVSNIVKNVELLERTNRDKRNKNLLKQLSLPVMSYDYQNELDLNLNDDKTTIEEIIEENTLFDDIQKSGFTEELENAPIAELESDSFGEEESEIVKQLEELPETKLIIPPVMMGAEMKPKNLIETAMQTILLDKVNIIGTYTPPTSPTLSETKTGQVFNVGSPTSSSNSIQTSQQFLPNMSRSITAISLSDYATKYDTVLGKPFTSLNSLGIKRQQSHPCLRGETNRNGTTTTAPTIKQQQSQICFSDSELHKPPTKLDKTTKSSEGNINKNKFAFINLLSRSNDSELKESDDTERRNSQSNFQRKRFSFLHFNRRKSYGPQSNLEKLKNKKTTNHKSLDNLSSHKAKSHIIPNIFHKHKKNSSTQEDVVKKQGLLGTALGNVVMETVQDILATSHAEKSGKSTTNPSTSQIIPTNNNSNNSNNVTPVNTQIDKGANINNNMHASLSPAPRNSGIMEVLPADQHGHHRTESVGAKVLLSPAKFSSGVPFVHRRSSDSDLSITPKGNSLSGSDRSGAGYFMKSNIVIRSTVPQDNFDMLEYPFLTMSKYPSGFILYLGGAVSARSVKLLERISNIEEPESRDIWWSEIRMEIRSHARALNCNAVLGYTETTSICDDVCVLSASGTAAVIGFQYAREIGDNITGLPVISKTHATTTGKDIMTSSLDRNDFENEKIIQKPEIKNQGKSLYESPEHDNNINGHINLSCTICHLPYNANNVPVRAMVLKCALCQSGKVPDVLLSTIETPDGISSIGRGCFIRSYVCRPLKDLKGESNAKEISDGLPFLEYELHRLLVNKLKIKGMNAIFGLKIRISIGERTLVGIATGTAVFLTPLPAPVLPKLVSDRTTDDKKLLDLQKHLHDTVKKNKEIYQIRTEENQNSRGFSDNDDSEEEQNSVDLSMGNKDCCVLEVDDPEDADVIHLLIEERPPDGFHVVNTEFVPGLEELEIVKNLQMFTQIYRAKLQPPYNLDVHFHRLLQSIYFKLRRMVPCALCDLQFRVDLPEPDEIQLCVLGMALGLGDPQKVKIKRKNTVVNVRNDDDLIFNLEDDFVHENNITSHLNVHHSLKNRQKSPLKNRLQNIRQRHVPYRERHGVDITPLSYIPGAKIERYLGNLNFFFIRETTSIREEGGLSGFIHSFVTEVLAIVRAHVTALGGNAMVAYFLTECVLNYNLHKNQGQCLINVGGDVVFVSYFNEDS